MNDTPPESANDWEELIVYLWLLHIVVTHFHFLVLVLGVKLYACIFEFKQGAALPQDVAELIHIFLVFACTTNWEGFLINHVSHETKLLKVLWVVWGVNFLHSVLDFLQK